MTSSETVKNNKSSRNSQYKFRTAYHPPNCISDTTTTSTTTTIIYPTPTNPFPATNHPIFTDAMYVRDKVFVVEQHCSAAAEIDEDDPRSWEWVVYARRHHNEDEEQEKDVTEEMPVGVIRLVPPPHAPHASNHGDHNNNSGISLPTFDYEHEPYVKVTRVAVLKEFRGFGLSRLLMNVVENWARHNKESIDRMYAEIADTDSAYNEQTKDDNISTRKGWNGLMGLHAQVQVEKMYQSLGYETDTSMGTWDEEGIEHIGMFKRLDLPTN